MNLKSGVGINHCYKKLRNKVENTLASIGQSIQLMVSYHHNWAQHRSL